MPTVAAHTLGCKVNQYDTQAMLELLSGDGYNIVPFHKNADLYLINTCTVTGTGDRKSLQVTRRIRREHPDSLLVVCGCMAQSRPDLFIKCGANLVIGTQNRHLIVSLVHSVLVGKEPICAVEPYEDAAVFEPLCISSMNEHTRAPLKIQEGCDNRCTYCIIPSVRGPVRSRPPESILDEIRRLVCAGYREIVVTGIHISSYGKDLNPKLCLPDALQVLQDTPGVERIRLGSLEPTVVTDRFASRLSEMDKICPHFHLALQSGSDTVLRRMKRRYSTLQYQKAVDTLRQVFPLAAITTDILTGFPGETQDEFDETCQLVSRIGFSRIHVFPYSPRIGTPAASMSGQLSDALKNSRTRQLIQIGEKSAERYLLQWIGKETTVIPEKKTSNAWEGYTPEYIRVRIPEDCTPGIPVRVLLTALQSRILYAKIIKKG